MTDAAPRRLQSFVDGFVEYTDGLPTPLIFRRWGAIAALAGLLERRVWVTTARREVYPNLYTLLVAPPGVGKSEVLREVSRLWRSMKDLEGTRKLHVAPDNMTKAALIKTLDKAKTRTVVSDIELLEYHSLLVASSEFSVFLPSYDTEFMSVLTDLYDCRDEYIEERIHSGETSIPNPQVHFIGGTTPGFMASTFPEQAWSMGFSSRLLLIYAADAIQVKLFGGAARSESLWGNLLHDARKISCMYGELSWDPEAAEILESWNSLGRQPEPTHPKLTTYNTRRILQVLKLVVVASVSRSAEMVVRPDDVATAIAWLLEAEQFMPSIFKDIGNVQGTGGGSILLDLHHWAMDLYQKTGNPLSESRMVNFLLPRVQYPNQVIPLLELAKRNGMFENEGTSWTPIGGQ